MGTIEVFTTALRIKKKDTLVDPIWTLPHTILFTEQIFFTSASSSCSYRNKRLQINDINM